VNHGREGARRFHRSRPGNHEYIGRDGIDAAVADGRKHRVFLPQGDNLSLIHIFKRPNFTNPSAAANLTAPGLFGKPTGTVGGWCCLGGQFTGTFAARLWF